MAPSTRLGALNSTSLSQLRKYWAVRSLGAGAISSTVDLMVLVLLVERAHLPPVIATALAVATGAALNFLLNKYVAFRDRDPGVARQAARFAAGVGASMVLHSALVYTLTQRFGLHYVFAKLLADVLIFTAGNLALNRYIVFPETAVLGRQAARALACLSLAAVLVGGPVLPSHSTGKPTLDASRQSTHDLGGAELRSLELTEPQPIIAPSAIWLTSDDGHNPRLEDGPRVPRAGPDRARLRKPPKA